MKNLFFALTLIAFTGLVSCTQPATNPEAAANLEKATANMELVKKFYSLMSVATMDSIDAFVATDVIDHNPDPMQKGTGLAAMKEMMKMYMTSFPDMKMEIVEIMADGDKVMVHAIVTGTNSGPMGPMPASNKAMKVDMYETLLLKDGKMTERWGVFDTQTMMIQLGLMPDPAAAAAAEPAAKQ